MKRIIVLSIIVFIFSSCADFLDVNQDLDSPYTSTPNYLLPPVLANMATSMFDHGEAEAYFTQQLGTLSGYHKYKDRWDYVDANRIAQWRRHYHDISINANHVMQSASRENSINYEGVARIIYAFTSQISTDVFGDMPYSEALNGNPSPKYDPQEEIYQNILSELDLAINDLQNADLSICRKMSGVEDIIYEGDIEKWIKFAYGVKARTLLHLTPNVNSNYQEILTTVNLALDGWEDALFDYSLGNDNTLQMNQWGRSKADPGWDYANNILDASAPTDFMLNQALHYDFENHIVHDPRQEVLMTPNANGEYLSVKPSEGKIATLQSEDYPDLYDSYMTNDRSKMPFMVKEELLFIKAEALFYLDEFSEAFNAFEEAIRLNMDRAGVIETDKIESFFSADFMPQNPNDLTLSDIMMQKYVALYLQGEIWVDMRRYDYSDLVYKGLVKPANLAYYWDEDDPNEWIERFPYDTETEEIYNRPTLEELGAYQNPDWLKNPMFWAK